MSNAQHTPGPWFSDAWSDGSFGVYVTGTVICSRNQFLARAEEFAANARLIAAAPSMYEYIASSASNGCAEAAKIMEAIHGGR